MLATLWYIATSVEVAPARNPNDVVPEAGVDGGRDCPPGDDGDDSAADADDGSDGDDDGAPAARGTQEEGMFHYPFPDSATAAACARGRYTPPSRQSAPLLDDLRHRQDAHGLQRSVSLPPVTDGVAALLARPVAGVVAAADEWQRACQRPADEPLDEDDLGGAAPPVDAVGPSVDIE